MILHDQHVHSLFSEDSEEDLKKYYLKAKKLGCQYFITTEHVDLDIAGMGVVWLADFNELKEVLNNIKESDGPIPLLGIELGYRKDLKDKLLKIIKQHDFDLINLSIHDSGTMDYYFIEGFKEKGLKNTIRLYYEQMLEAVENWNDFNVLSHINYGYKTIYNYDPSYDFFSDIEIIKKILIVLIQKNKALEINTKVADDLPIENTIGLLELYKELGGSRITISSDAHELSRYLENFDKYVNIVKEIGFKYLCYFIKGEEKHFYL